MAALGRLLALACVLTLAACVTPEIKLDSGDTAMQVRSKVPAVLTVSFSPDGKTVASGSFDGAAKIWDLGEAKQLHALRRPGQARVVAYLPDRKTVAVGNYNAFGADEITLWSLANGVFVRNLPVPRFLRGLTYSPDGRRIFVRGRDGSSLVDADNGDVLAQFAGQSGALSPNGRLVAVCGVEASVGLAQRGSGGFVKLFETRTGQEVWKQSQGDANCGGAAFSPDGRSLLIAVNARARSLRLLDVETGARRKEFGQEPMSGVLSQYGAVAFSPDGKYAISGDLSGSYKVWDVQAGSLLRQLKSAEDHKGSLLNVVPSVGFSPDGRTVVVTTLAATRLFAVATGEELASMISFEDGEWLVTTPQGYYNSSDKGDQYLDVAVAGKPYSISQFRESFFRPDLVKAALAGRALGELRKIADVKPPPAVSIVETPTSVSGDEVTVTLNVTDQGGGVGDVRLYRNGSAVMLESTRNLQVAQAARALRYKVRLESGGNAIRAVAFNADNSMQSADASITVTANFGPRRPTLYAVAAGIQDFKNPRLKLSYPIADATLFAETLRSQAGALYQAVDITLLTTPQQTSRDNLTQILTGLKDKVRPEDLFVFFVASHGTADEGEYFLITSNVGSVSTPRLKLDALTQADLKGLLANIPATKKFIVIDTCNAGALGDALQAAFLTRGMSDATAMKILGRAVGSTVLSASTSTQEALEGYKGHGLFTYVIAEGLAGKADANKDGFVSTLELAGYVDERVPVLAEEIFKHAQYPVVSPSGQGFPLVRVK